MKEKPPLPNPVIDTVDNHTHVEMCGVTDPKTLKELLDRAKSVGVNQLITVGTDVESSKFQVTAASWETDVYAAIAIHPTEAHLLDENAKNIFNELVKHPKTVAIGETGLDYYWLEKSPETTASKEAQIQSFKWHIELAKQNNKVLMIHNRSADDDVFKILEEVGEPETVVMHCFSSDVRAMETCIERGYYASISGNVSFKNAKEIQEAVKILPLDLMLVETDAPFLTPHPYRGMANESYCIPYTLDAIAQLKNLDINEIASHTAKNARKVYRLENV